MTFEVGDRVRVTFETTVAENTEGNCLCTEFGDSLDLDYLEGLVRENPDTATVEVIESPVTVFGPGDRVRHRPSGNEYIILRGNKYLSLQFLEVSKTPTEYFFTSEYYDLVEHVGESS